MDRYDDSSALIVVDMQNDFAKPLGSLYVKGGEEVVNAINHEIAAARASGALVVFTQDWHPPDTPHFQKDGGIWPVHCVGGTWGSELVESLAVQEGDRTVRKGVSGEDGYSGFTVADPKTGQTHPTELESLLQDAGVSKVTVVGLATDYCVKATAIDAAKIGLQVVVLSDATRAVNLEVEDGERAIDEMRLAGIAVE